MTMQRPRLSFLRRSYLLTSVVGWARQHTSVFSSPDEIDLAPAIFEAASLGGKAWEKAVEGGEGVSLDSGGSINGARYGGYITSDSGVNFCLPL